MKRNEGGLKESLGQVQQQKEALLRQENNLLQSLQTLEQEKQHLFKLRHETLEEIKHLSEWVREQQAQVSKAAALSKAASFEFDLLMKQWQTERQQASQAPSCRSLQVRDSSEDEQAMFEACLAMEQEVAAAQKQRQIAAAEQERGTAAAEQERQIAAEKNCQIADAEQERKRLSSEAGVITDTAEERQVKNLKTSAGAGLDSVVTGCSPSSKCQTVTDSAEKRQVKKLKTSAGAAGQSVVQSCSLSSHCQGVQYADFEDVKELPGGSVQCENPIVSVDVISPVSLVAEKVSWKLLPSVGTWLQATHCSGR